MFPKILDSTFPIASEEPGPGAFRCPGSPQPTTPPPPPRNQNEASRREGARVADVGVASSGQRPGPPLTRASPAAQLDSSTRRRRRGRVCGGRAAALLRRGPARNCPSPRRRRASAAGSRSAAAAASRRRGRLRPSGPRAPAPHRPRPPRGSEAPAARQGHGSSRELGALPAETQKARGSYCRGPAGSGGPRRPAFPARPGRLPPAAAPSAGSLRPPPPPPSSAAAAAGKGAEETASLPLPTAHAQHGPTVRTRATSVRKAPARPASGAPRAKGRGYGGPEGSQVRPAPGPARLGLRPLCPPVAALASPPLSAVSQHPPLELEEQIHGWGGGEAAQGGARGCPLPGRTPLRAASRSFLRPRCPPEAPRVASTPPLPWRPLGPSGKALPAAFTFPPALPRPPLFLVLRALPGRHVGDNCFLWNLPASECSVFTSLALL